MGNYNLTPVHVRNASKMQPSPETGPMLYTVIPYHWLLAIDDGSSICTEVGLFGGRLVADRWELVGGQGLLKIIEYDRSGECCGTRTL